MARTKQRVNVPAKGRAATPRRVYQPPSRMRDRIRIRYRGSGQWLVAGVAFAVGVGLLVWCATAIDRDFELRSHGVQALATVDAVSRQGKNFSYTVEFTLADGSLQTASTTELSGAAVGDTATVVYLPSDPSDIATPVAISRWWVSLIAVPIAVLPFWFAWLTWRMDSARFWWVVRSSRR
ncbi:DUF3592 domain-containing protein [Actinospica durhamensis]|uniref:DUF3592 domain-containing protein n=1 Tax=Actinospica durhamensis TaxID=1508375 RepID=A0A941IUP4_9ACTN|nr:DUF3592 domain-containing protein [Actinospica durhamensis]MBR7839412.1 DUF3592 domain-containing protein [Actinospica durhamensis]